MTWKSFRIIALILTLTVAGPTCVALGQWGGVLDSVRQTLGLGGELSTTKIVEGLKEALSIGTEKAVRAVSRAGGYYKNPEIRIPLPAAVRNVEGVIRGAGLGPNLNAFEKSINRAAERAAPEAKALFWDVIKGVTITEARRILEGSDEEATIYLKSKTFDRLHGIFRPIVHNAMTEVGVTRMYQVLYKKVSALPFLGNVFSFDLDGYVTDGALEGLFFMVADEERKIRRDPVARVTPILKEVFGN